MAGLEDVVVIPETQLPSEEDSTSVMSTGIDRIEVQCIGVPFVYTIPSRSQLDRSPSGQW